MMEVETELDTRFDGIDVESIIARAEKRGPFSRRRCLYQAPEFIQRLPAEETVQEGTTVTFGCKIMGFPKPTITWYKDDDVIGPDARAIMDSDDNNGIQCVKLQEVSKCDAGTYKVRATNLEGSSASSLYLSVKAKARNRNRKSKKNRTIACAPPFPVIVEHEAEEMRETLAVEEQPESPLTPIYTNISRRSPVSWPTFLGEWAYNMEEVISRDDGDLDVGCEDVFGNEPDNPAQQSLTFVSSVYAQMNGQSPNVNSLNNNNCDKVNNIVESNTAPYSHSDGINTGNVNTVSDSRIKTLVQTRFDTDNSSDTERENNIANTIRIVNENSIQSVVVNDILNNNNNNNNNSGSALRSTVSNQTGNHNPRNHNALANVPSVELEEKTVFIDPSTISKIAVNRSYARGNATFSVATRRSPSPYSESRKPVASQPSENLLANYDTPTLQNMNNEILQNRMMKTGYRSSPRYCLLLSRDLGTWDDHMAEMILMVCGSTFLALCMELSPTTFVFDLLIAMIVKCALGLLFRDT